jgi:hypothetical protein
VIDVQHDLVQALMPLNRERADPVSPRLRQMLGITRHRRIGMAHAGQVGSTIGNSIRLVMGSPFATRDPRLQAYHHMASRARIIAGLSGFLTLIQSRDGPDR